MDGIKELIQNSKITKHENRQLKKAGWYDGRNVSITMKMSMFIQTHRHIMRFYFKSNSK